LGAAAPNAQNPLHPFPCNFPVEGEVVSSLQTCYGETGVIDFGLKGLFPLRLRVALRGVAWRAIVSDSRLVAGR